jgi:iron complex outermembrane receptor protein
VEYLRESYQARSGDTVPGTERTLAWRKADRNNKSVFAELSVPIIHSLNLSASARYDDYSDFGETTNPKYAFTYEPLQWITFRGSWGKSFNAPSLADAAGALNQATLFSALTLPSPVPGQFVPAQAFWPLIALQGGVADIQPQTAETLSAGFEVRPPPIPGLTLSAGYYRILFKDLIGFPPVFDALDFYTSYTRFYILGPTQQQLQNAVQDIPGGPNVIAGLFDPGDPPIYALIDARRRNLGNAKLSGIDFSVRYVHDTGFGSVDASFAGTYELERTDQPLPGLPWIDQLESDISRFRSVGTVGADIGRLRAQAQWNHSEGFKTMASTLQAHVGSFDVVNLFVSYDVRDDLQLTLNLNNVLDQDPPRFRGTYGFVSDGYANGSTLGRFIQLGFSEKF